MVVKYFRFRGKGLVAMEESEYDMLMKGEEAKAEPPVKKQKKKNKEEI